METVSYTHLFSFSDSHQSALTSSVIKTISFDCVRAKFNSSFHMIKSPYLRTPSYIDRTIIIKSRIKSHTCTYTSSVHQMCIRDRANSILHSKLVILLQWHTVSLKVARNVYRCTAVSYTHLDVYKRQVFTPMYPGMGIYVFGTMSMPPTLQSATFKLKNGLHTKR